ncbi:MAG TPA: hypothetical protein VGB55_13225 [Tepidisphaeraceae bacterium]|jgi:hypothetical protein
MRFKPALLTLLFLTAASQGQSTSALINESMDKIVDLNLDATLPQAMKGIEDQTAVPIRVSRAVYDALPWGDQTKLTAKISNQTLRNSLTAITGKLGLYYTIGDEAVELQPMAALVRIGRRSTVEELNAIDTLSSTPFKAPEAVSNIHEAVRGINAQLAEAKVGLAVEDRVSETSGGFVRASPSMKAFKGQSLLEVLEEIHRQTGGTWYPWGRSVVIVPKEDHVRMLLDRPITLRFAGVDVSQVLSELSRRSGVPFTVEPGAVQRILPESRTIKLVLENVSTRQALESISGFTGLGYLASENGVYIWNPAASPTARRADRVMAIIKLEDGTELLLPESEVPADLKQFIEKRKQRAIEQMREQMKKEGFKPTPTTQPQ